MSQLMSRISCSIPASPRKGSSPVNVTSPLMEWSLSGAHRNISPSSPDETEERIGACSIVQKPEGGRVARQRHLRSGETAWKRSTVGKRERSEGCEQWAGDAGVVAVKKSGIGERKSTCDVRLQQRTGPRMRRG